MTPFRPGDDGYEAFWEEAERHVLAGVAREVADMLREQAGLPDDDEDDPLGTLTATTQSTGTPREPDDPAARRLLPDASRDDDAVAAEFRHLTQTDLAAAKVRGLERFAALLEGAPSDAPFTEDPDDDDRAVVLVTRENAREFAAALTDVRLVVAQRLGLETDDDVETLHDEVLAGTDPDDDEREIDPTVRRYWGGIFVAAGFAQESLVGAMLDDHRARTSGG
ncbi:hypothetical protein Xcel_1057 [Xylanimonas cellulosilytica DSM 15894]|uniref:Uncharacterized protein n=1 Tax=Xylanimonas cellulosilytica (strain DSM 15894 / JCM 12276 / CECT 5975 / KCTC 9989 / LMG 20990 / NBRC 107835 / XIL07) TaxID=446471 RepID=D1BZD4_XYLCX|nr:DUF2017 family protein [Xylanimonas cellulosilytica]ACZ30088.1 hypothetical protein Xcel_1057 [Xylanimonas cellulosilytica DSM 15894]